ncbi:MAG: nuclear transport factor 2 family protein [Nitrospinaceae bacterium]|jgi:hypothetical protein|nr:nuclear transport factor 2 family protein [Nitrospinaceae bacterium]MBT3432482.1 nuclear transport factor 2 family protein [Nitrospinaceae bacterium]MBT3821145.1 nuclear transport factor 2 family protein [Nitrospinaceae bacterium]MBT4095408.1 nuclear transport factor 2 family protein [Nitrospinaceae bacterium]MBT4430175.1 nuclear transport factor 2 family protein [Nitrospinaceae bacterium]
MPLVDIQTLIDEQSIMKTVIAWGAARDSSDWERLRACYHADGEMHIMWTSDSADTFVERLKARPPAPPGEHQKHLVSSPDIRVSKNRAVSECHITLYSRLMIDDIEFDFTAWIRFYDLFERRDGVWRIKKRTAIYEKDRMDPVKSSDLTPDYFENMSLSEFPEACKFMCYRHSKRGLTPSPTLATAGSEIEATLKKEGMAWLESSS